MNKKLFAPIFSIAVLAAVSVGATFALFTDKKETNVSIHAGIVKVGLTTSVSSAYSRYEDPTPFDAKAAAEGTAYAAVYENSNTASVGSDESGRVLITLDRMTPMDDITLKISVANLSNVKIKYRLGFELTGELIPALEVNFDGTDYSTSTVPSTKHTLWSSVIDPETTSLVEDKKLYIAFPDHDGKEGYADGFDDLYQGKSGNILIFAEAVQGNAHVED
ncbi:MAG: SipW-dependent-type signal peptide-containing protein [Bacilli bacterium]|nr:SipW-dependent-type signal peptide-containing protein [Bacilli bacterium]